MRVYGFASRCSKEFIAFGGGVCPKVVPRSTGCDCFASPSRTARLAECSGIPSLPMSTNQAVKKNTAPLQQAVMEKRQASKYTHDGTFFACVNDQLSQPQVLPTIFNRTFHPSLTHPTDTPTGNVNVVPCSCFCHPAARLE